MKASWIIAEPEGEATNLDAQVAKRLCICIYFSLYVYMPVTVSYGHLARGHEIVSVAIPMTSSCFLYLYNDLNSQFRLLLILCRAQAASKSYDKFTSSMESKLAPHWHVQNNLKMLTLYRQI